MDMYTTQLANSANLPALIEKPLTFAENPFDVANDNVKQAGPVELLETCVAVFLLDFKLIHLFRHLNSFWSVKQKCKFSLKYLIYYWTEFVLFFVFKIIPKTWHVNMTFFNYNGHIKQKICFHFTKNKLSPKRKENTVTLLRI